MVTPKLLAAAKLKDLIETGQLASRVRTPLGRNPQYDTLAPCVESIGRGLMALGAVGTNLLIDISGNVTKICGRFQRDVYCHKFVFFNLNGPGCACIRPRDSGIFGVNGALGLRAVTLEVGQGYDGPLAEIGLVLPVWASERRQPDVGEFAILKVDFTGYSEPTRYMPFVRTAAGTESYANWAGCLKHATGIVPREGLQFSTTGCASIDQAVGFPGAEAYLVTHLPKLGDYLTALAASLSVEHRH